ncbi:MAG: hypothetical protein KJN99_00375 [Marinicaulis sp.]|nr:hypothetical protein [Marinicaulis sp.]
MDRETSPLVFLFTAIVMLGALLSSSVMLPHERYYRFQAHDNVTTRKADWIYERLHFDETPVDVALIGTSRMAGGLSGPQIERAYCEATGRRIHVANFAIPVTGRNMHYVIAKEAARQKAPALIVVELNDVESRRPHPGFIILANAEDVLSAPLILNLNYFSDLIRLPGRQFQLFIEKVLNRPKIRQSFDKEDYAGPNLDLTEIMFAIDGRIKSRRITHSREHMEFLREKRAAKIHRTFFLPGPLKFAEYRFARIYLNKIERVGAAHGGDVEYAYMPAYGEPAAPVDMLAEIRLQTPSFDLGADIATDHEFWLDATHLNADGAAEASKRFTEQLVASGKFFSREGACK